MIPNRTFDPSRLKSLAELEASYQRGRLVDRWLEIGIGWCLIAMLALSVAHWVVR